MRARTEYERQLVQKAFQYLPGGSLGNVIMKPEDAFLIARGKGSRVWDVSGNEYIDYLLGSGPEFLGHGHPALTAAVHRVLDHGFTFFHTNEASVLLAEEFVKAVPCAEQVRFMSSGTEADLLAMRIARAYRRRDKVLKFEGGYHGVSDYGWASINNTETPEFPYTAIPEAAGIPQAALDLVLVAPFNDLETTAAVIEQRHDELAAVIVEPMQRILPPVPGFLEGLRAVTADYQIPLIFDEVVTGFRLAYGGAQEYYGVTPDLATYAKVAGGGMPLAAVAGRAEIMAVCDPNRVAKSDFVHTIGTLSGNPIAVAASLAALEVLRQPGVYDQVRAAGRRLMEGLRRVFQQAELPAQVLGEEPCFDVYFTDQPIRTYRDTLRADRQMLAKYNDALLRRGILKGSQKYYVGPCHSEEDLQLTLQAFEETAEELRG